MERGGGYSQSLAQSFSLPSLVEGSEPISEQEEFMEMKSLRERGDKALKISDFSQAIRCYNEALEIDDRNADILLARATALIQMGDYIGAQRDTELLISQETDNSKAYHLQGIALKFLNQNKEALTCLLTALHLDPDNADELTDVIADVSANFCSIEDDLVQQLKEMDSYKKLSEVGVCLFQAKKYKICIKILDAAQKFQTNQKGITMRILLTLANAHSAINRTDKAISLYQECLTTAIATHDQVYQTKALVNIATLYLEHHDTHQAILYYEKLLHLEADILQESGSEEVLPDFWTRELQCGLHLNLSIAYKSISDMHSAIKHAKKYVYYIEKYGFQGKLKAESYHNTGMLNEILGNNNEAINNYNKYLQESKQNGDKKGMAQAYGCLGSVYASLRNWKLSITFHEQYVVMAARFKDKRMQTIANEMLADTLMLKGDFEAAVTAYEEMINCCLRTDYRTKSMAMCKLGNAHRALKKNQYSLYFYQQASDLAEDFDVPEVLTLCQYNIACINQNSTQLLELEKALKFFIHLIPFFETKIREHSEEDSHCPDEYHIQLRECYDGIQTVMVKLGNKDECLQYAEAYRKRHLTQTHNYQASAISSQSHMAPWDMWTMDRITRVVGQQNGTILYYSLLRTHLVLWVLQPGEGLVRFYSRKAGKDENMIETVESLVDEIRRDCDWRKMQNACEARAVPKKFTDLEMTRHKNLGLGKRSKEENEKENQSTKIQQDSRPEKNSRPEKTAARRLYDLLFSPVEDILSKIARDCPLIVVPDKALHHCPFGILQDFLNRYAFQRFHITSLPNILLLDKVVANENNSLRIQDDLAFSRSQNKQGGILRFMNKSALGTEHNQFPASSPPPAVSPKRVSNPRLLNLSQTKTPSTPKSKMPAPMPGKLPRQQTMFDDDFQHHSTHAKPKSPRGLKPIPESVHSSRQSPRTSRLGSPTSIDKMLSYNTYSTLTTETSTGTDVTTSINMITQYRQVSCQERCLVFGNPSLPKCVELHDRLWQPGLEDLVSAKRELLNVASYLDVAPTTGLDATKERFMKDVAHASVIHIVTYGCWKEGLLVCAPALVNADDEIPRQDSYVVTADDILGLKLVAQLVVINTGYSPYRREPVSDGYLLPSAFLAAGAQCVMIAMWPLPDFVVEKFYHGFYLALQNGCLVTDAAQTALEIIKKDDRYSATSSPATLGKTKRGCCKEVAVVERYDSPFYWSAFALIGKDVKVNLRDIRHAMLDQTIDQSETEVEESLGNEYLNPKPVLRPVRKKEENLAVLQESLSGLLRSHTKHAVVVAELIDLLDSALKRLHTMENNRQTSHLTETITTSPGAVDLLKLLGFHFQAKGNTVDNPYVVYPHWNRDELLIPTFDALRAIQELSQSSGLVLSLCSVLPISQDNISLLVDLLSVTKHAPEVQLKVSDLSIRPLWLDMKLKQLLIAAGFHQIGMLLDFTRTPENKVLLASLLQMLLAVSQHKSQVLLYRLDVALLGNSPESKATSVYPDLPRLPSLTPLILPRNQLRMSTPWLSTMEHEGEMDEKLKLARSRTDVDENFRGHLERAKTWHQMTVIAQANETLAKYGRPQSMPQKVKVIAGGSGSTPRIPVDQEPMLVIPEVGQRRDYAHYVYQQRVENIDSRRRNEVLKLYLPYVGTV